MDTLVVILIAVLVVVLVWWSIERRRLTEHLSKLYRAELATQGMMRARQSKMGFDRTSRQSPEVDAKGRTTQPRHVDARGGKQRPVKFTIVGGPDERH